MFTQEQIAKLGGVSFGVKNLPFQRVNRSLKSRWYIPKTEEKSIPIPMGNEHARLKLHCEIYSQLHKSASSKISMLVGMQQQQKSYLLSRTLDMTTLNDGRWIIESINITGEKFLVSGEPFKTNFSLNLIEYPNEEN